MTTETALPSPAALVAEAIAIGRSITSTDHDIVRARLLLDIAHELRVANDERRREGLAAKVAADALEAALRRPASKGGRTSAIDLLTEVGPAAAARYRLRGDHLHYGGTDLGGVPAWLREAFRTKSDVAFGYRRGQVAAPTIRQIELARDALAAGTTKRAEQVSLLEEIVGREEEAYVTRPQYADHSYIEGCCERPAGEHHTVHRDQLRAWDQQSKPAGDDLGDAVQATLDATQLNPLAPFTMAEMTETKRFVLDDLTKAVPLLTGWQEGDESTCRFCQTPVILSVAAIPQQTYGNGGTDLTWRHKYTGQAVCAHPITAEQIDTDSVPGHTFATPITAQKDLATGGTLYGGGGSDTTQDM